MVKRSVRPVHMGLLFGAIGILLTIVGMVRGVAPSQPLSVAIALVLGGGVWFLIAWAVATAARDVEHDVAAQAETASDGVQAEK